MIGERPRLDALYISSSLALGVRLLAHVHVKDNALLEPKGVASSFLQHR